MKGKRKIELDMSAHARQDKDNNSSFLLTVNSEIYNSKTKDKPQLPCRFPFSRFTLLLQKNTTEQTFNTSVLLKLVLVWQY